MESEQKKETEVERTKPMKEAEDERPEDVGATEGQYFNEELFDDLSLLQSFFDSRFVIECEEEESTRNPVAPTEEELCLKARIVPSEHTPSETGEKRCVY